MPIELHTRACCRENINAIGRGGGETNRFVSLWLMLGLLSLAYHVVFG